MVLAGTLIIIRPGLAAPNPGGLLALASGTSLALYFLLIRRIAGRNKAIVTTCDTNAIGAVIASILVTFVWTTPTATGWFSVRGPYSHRQHRPKPDRARL